MAQNSTHSNGLTCPWGTTARPPPLQVGQEWVGHTLLHALDPDARVGLARRLHDGTKRALKFAPNDARHDERLRALFSSEIAQAARLQSPLFPAVLDFGSVAPLFAPPSRAGTPSYIAPERFKSAPHSERTEIYGIGVTLFEAATRAYSYGEIERLQNPRFTSSRRPGKLNSALPDWLEAVLLRSVAAEPTERYQNYSQLTFDLEHPDKVEPFFAPNTPLLERNPLLVWKILAAILAALNLLQFFLRK